MVTYGYDTKAHMDTRTVWNNYWTRNYGDHQQIGLWWFLGRCFIPFFLLHLTINLNESEQIVPNIVYTDWDLISRMKNCPIEISFYYGLFNDTMSYSVQSWLTTELLVNKFRCFHASTGEIPCLTNLISNKMQTTTFLICLLWILRHKSSWLLNYSISV